MKIDPQEFKWFYSIFVFSNQIMNCLMQKMWEELNWDNNRFIVTERRTNMKQMMCKLYHMSRYRSPFRWDNEIKRSKTPYKQRRCRIIFLQIVYELLCLSVNNDTISKIRWKLICPTIEVEAYLKQEGRAMNITILPDDWLETCNDVKWLRVNLAYLYISTDFSIYLWDLVRAFFTLFLCFSACCQPKVWFLQ